MNKVMNLGYRRNELNVAQAIESLALLKGGNNNGR